MKVDFDNLRVQALQDYETIVRRMNNSIATDDDYVTLSGRLINTKGYIVIDPEDIRKELDSLRMEIITICLCKMQGGSEEAIKSVLPERTIISLIDSED